MILLLLYLRQVESEVSSCGPVVQFNAKNSKS
jgi:hypothetical protein